MTDDNDDFVLDEDEQHSAIDLERRQRFVLYNNLITSAVVVISDYMSSSNDKIPCMTSAYTGDKWVGELLAGHPSRFHIAFKMSSQIFTDLLQLLQTSYGLEGSQRTTAREVLAITLYTLAHKGSMRLTSERFQHSTETISRLFSRGLDALSLLAVEMIKPLDPEFRSTPAHILHDDRYMPYFKDCIGAIDGTHVDACIPVVDQVRYIGRHGSPSQNIMVICDFDMCFTYVVPGWEGSAHDSRIFQRAVNDPSCQFPHPPPGKYYLVDAGYPLQRGILKPYPETRYHLPDFARGNRPISGRRELFNKAHSSLRSVIERTFGVWKKKWGILRKMPQYPFSKQCVIVVATMTLHNYIRRHPSRVDREFNACDMDPTFVHRQAYEVRATRNRRITTANQNIDPVTFEGTGANEMSALRDLIADQLQHDRR